MQKSKEGLKLFDTLVISMASVIAAGIFVLSSVAINRASGSIIVSILIAIALAIFSGISFAELSRAIAKEGGVYEYTREGFSDNVGFVVGWLWIAAFLALAAASGLTAANYIDIVLNASIPTAAIATIIIVIAALFVASRLRLSIKLLALFVAASVLAILIFVVFGMRFVNTSDYSFTITYSNIKDILFGAAVSFIGFVGFARITTVGSKIIDRDRSVYLSVFLSLVVLFVLYMAFALVTIGVLKNAKISSSALLIEAFLANRQLLVPLFGFLRILALFGLIWMSISAASRIFFLMGRNYEMPWGLQKLDKNSKPRNSVVLSTILAVAFIFVSTFATLVDIASAALLVVFAIVQITVINISLKGGGNHKKDGSLIGNKAFLIIPILGILGNLAVLFSVSRIALTLMFGILLVGSLYYTYGRVLVLPKEALDRYKRVKRRETSEYNEITEFTK